MKELQGKVAFITGGASGIGLGIAGAFSEVGALVLKAVQNDEFYVVTHGEWRPMAEARHAAIIAAMPEKLDPRLVAMLQARRPEARGNA